MCNMLPDSRKIVLSIFFVFYLIVESKNASLSLSEQKKYKSFIEGQGLYTQDDEIEILTAFNFKNEIYNKNHAWVVEFYNSWCGFCQRFAPSWKALGTDIKGWNDLIKVGAIDCADDDNNPICRDFEIMAYPTLRYFHENYSEGPKNLGTVVQKGEDLSGHKMYLIETMASEQNVGRGSFFPNLRPYTSRSLNELYGSLGSSNKYVFLIIQETNSTLGPEIALDLHNIKDVIIRYANSNNTELLSSIGVSKASGVLAVGPDRNPQILGQGLGSKKEVNDAITSFLKSHNIEVPDTTNKKPVFTGKWIDAEVPDITPLLQERERKMLMEKVKKMGDVVFQIDLETALRYSLKHEVANGQEITGDKLNALKAYLSVLHKYFPFGSNGRQFLSDLQHKAEEGGNVVKTNDLYNLIVDAEPADRKIYSSPQEWLGCMGSTAEHRGYPCGLWKMFHYLTVNAAEHNSANSVSNPREVLDAMYGYIKYFFGCAECSQHFQEMAARRAIHNVSSYESSILWLWMAHNEVNKRLAGDKTEDPEFPKIQFPSPEKCSNCKYNDGSFNYPEVLTYLKQMYSSINVRYIKSDTRVLHMGLEGEEQVHSGSPTIFRTIDTITVFLVHTVIFGVTLLQGHLLQ